MQSCKERALKLRLTRSVSTRETRFYECARSHSKTPAQIGIFKSVCGPTTVGTLRIDWPCSIL